MSQVSKEDIKQLRDLGYSYQEIGDKYGVSRQDVYAKYNFSKRKIERLYVKPKIREIVKLRTEGLTAEEIADMFNIDSAAVKKVWEASETDTAKAYETRKQKKKLVYLKKRMKSLQKQIGAIEKTL